MNSQKNIGIIVLLVIGIGVTISWYKKPSSLCTNLSCIRMNTPNAFHQKEIYADAPDIYRALYATSTDFLRIEAKKVVHALAHQEKTAAITQMKALFEKAPAPYPGEISDAIVCDPAYIPEYKEAFGVNYFVGFLNDRLTFGSCSKDQAVYKGVIALIYCPTSSLLIKVERIAKTADFMTHEQEILREITSLSCPRYPSLIERIFQAVFPEQNRGRSL